MAIVKSTYTDEQWEQARELITTKPETQLSDIAATVGIPLIILENRAVKQNWLAARDYQDAKLSTRNLNRVIGEVALQLNDVHQHTAALLEAIQYSHRIKIDQDSEGRIHYKNFEEFPGKPSQDIWDNFSEEQKEAALRYISPSRLARFMADLMTVLNLKNNNINFITKMIKGGLPKVDPNILDLSRRDSDSQVMDGIPIFNLPVDDTVKKEEENEPTKFSKPE